MSRVKSFPVPIVVLVLLVASAAFYLWTRPNAVSRHQAGVSVQVANTAVAGVSNTVATAVSNGAAHSTQTSPSGGQASSSVGAKGPTAKQKVDGNGNAATSPATAPNSSAPTPPGEDPYAWLAEPPPGTPCPPLNIAFDLTRSGREFSWLEEKWRKVILASARSRLSFKPVYLELTHEELENANMFILPVSKGGVYTPAEKNVLSNFVQRGGVVLCWRGEYPVGNDFLKDYGGEIQELPLEKPFTSLSAAKVPWWANRQIEVTGAGGFGRGVFNLGKSSSAWHPVLTGRDGLAALTFRRVGKGQLLYISNQCFWGDAHWAPPKRYNAELMASVFDACARLARKVDPGKPFLARDLETAPVKLKSSYGPRIYASKELRDEAYAIKAYYDKMLPALKELTGRKLKEKLDSVYMVVSKRLYGYSNHDSSKSIFLHGIRKHGKAFDVKWGDAWGPFANWWFGENSPEFSTSCYNQERQSFSSCFARYVHAVLLEQIGERELSTNYIGRIVGWEKSRNVLTGYWSDGEPKEGVPHKKMTNDYALIELNEAKVFALMEELRRRKPDLIRCLYHELDQLVAQGRVDRVANIHQTAAIFSRVMEADMFPLFEKYGFRVEDRRKARFGRSKVDLKTLESVNGKPALKGKEFDLQKVKGKGPKSVWLEMVGCPAGIAQMGSRGDVNGPLWTHQIAITEPFWIGRTQVTKLQWAEVMGKRSASKSRLVDALGGGSTAADHLSYTNVLQFCEKLTERFRHLIPLGYVFRPPTEAEWEYACDAGKMDGRATGGLAMADVKKVCWTKDDSLARITSTGVKLPTGFDRSRLPMGPVGKKQPNAWGIYDMLGNGWEWCLDTLRPPSEGMDAAYARTREYLQEIFFYKPEEQDPLFSYTEANAYACARGMNYTGAGSCTKTVFPVDAEPSAEMTFRVCLGPELIKERSGNKIPH